MGQERIEKEMDEQRSLEKSIPDIYVNNVGFSISVYDVQFNFGVQSGPEEAPERVAIIRMSPQHALAMAKLLLKNLRVYEEKVGKINLPKELLKELGIEEDSPNESDAES